MALFTISDLHLPLGVDKPMDIFGMNWDNYVAKIEKNWRDNIQEGDYVVLPGDFCWAMRLNDAKPDFDFINLLPGIKILLKGNHDYWWETLSKNERYMSQEAYTNIHFLQNNVYMYNNTAICGTRFWLCPGSNSFSGDDRKIYLRELGRVELSLQSSAQFAPEEIIFFTHYPPMVNFEVDEAFLSLMNKYNVSRVFFGHIHQKNECERYNFEFGGVNFKLVSCDIMDFMPLKIKE